MLVIFTAHLFINAWLFEKSMRTALLNKDHNSNTDCLHLDY